MIAGLYITTLLALAKPAELSVTQDANGMKYCLRYKQRACSFIIPTSEIFSAATDEQLVTLIKNKIIEARDSLVK